MPFFKMKAILNIVPALQMLIYLILTTTATTMYVIDTIIYR